MEKEPNVQTLKGTSLSCITRTSVLTAAVAVGIHVVKYLIASSDTVSRLLHDSTGDDQVTKCLVGKILQRNNICCQLSVLLMTIFQFVIVDIYFTNYLLAKCLDYHSIRTKQRVLRLFVVGISCSLGWELIKSGCEPY